MSRAHFDTKLLYFADMDRSHTYGITCELDKAVKYFHFSFK